ncbi:MAG: helicase-related protein [Prevotella sp.]
MSCHKAKEVISECVKWDGSIINKNMDYYSSTIKSQTDFYNAVACIAGYSCNVTIEKDNRKSTYNNIYRLFINKSLVTKDTTLMYTKKQNYEGFVYCVEMPKGTIVIRHNGFTFISGNCHQQDFNWIFEKPGIKEKYIIGATATPKRTNSQVELAHQYSDIVAGPDVQEMINIGYLCPDKYYSVPVDMSGVKTKGGDYDTEQMYGRYNKSELYSGVIDNWKRICPDTITLCFCVNIQHCVNTCKAFNEAGIKAKFIVSDLSNPKQRSENKADISLFKLKKEEYQNYLINFERYSGERKKIINQWEQGEFKVLINAGIATTGFDFPPIQTIIMDRSTTSDNLLLQILGRGSRISDGKEYFNILDFGDNCSRLGYYRQQREYSLFHETKNSGGGVPPVKECTQCHALVFASSRVCKYCGYVFPLTHDEKIVELKEVKYSEATTHLTSIHDYEVFAETKGYKKSWMFRQVYIKFGIEGLKEYAKSHHISPTWVYVQKARYDAQGIRRK